MDRDELLWKQYELNVELYKFHLDVVVKVVAFHYAVTGAILTYHFQHKGDAVTNYALYLPIALSAILCFLFVYGALRVGIVRRELEAISGQLKLKTAPAIQLLTLILWAFAILLFLTAMALVWVIVARLTARPMTLPSLF
jgi:hypothetical protein